jgi:hypothetical protein
MWCSFKSIEPGHIASTSQPSPSEHETENGALIAVTCLSIALANSLLCQGSVLLVGGGSEDYGDWSDQPYRWLVNHAPNKVILVMHYSDGSTWLESYFRSFGATSATSLIISTKTAANDSVNYRAILAASGVFLRGGDQWQYVNLWKGTLVEKAIRELFQRGGVVGGGLGQPPLFPPATFGRTRSSLTFLRKVVPLFVSSFIIHHWLSSLDLVHAGSVHPSILRQALRQAQGIAQDRTLSDLCVTLERSRSMYLAESLDRFLLPAL